jgi:adenylate cyclase
VELLDRVFARRDALAAEHGVEKIKTIGDAYMVASGIPLPREGHVETIAEMALDMGPEVASLAIVPGTIQVTERLYERLRPLYELRPRGTIEVKGKGPISPYLLHGRRGEQEAAGRGDARRDAALAAGSLPRAV